MKQRFSLFLLTLCLLLTACSGTSGQEFDDFQPMPGFDAQNKYLLAGGFADFLETDDFFCGGGSEFRYLRYYDKASGVSGVLCADPACGHDDNTCSAYVGMNGASLSWYDGALYWVAKGEGEDRDDYLWRDDLSGAGREKIKRISLENIVFEYQPQWYTIHRGKLYFLGRANVVTETGEGHRTTLVSVPLDEFEEFTVLYDQTFDSSEPTVRFVGNSVYLAMASWQWDENGVLDETLTITKIDCTTGESEVIYEETGLTRGIGGMWVTEQGEIYVAQWGDNYGGSVWKIEDGKRTEVISWEGDHSSIDLMDGIAINLTAQYREDGSRIRYVDISNYAGETLYCGELFPNGVLGIEGNPSDLSIATIGGDAEKMLFVLENHFSNPRVSYMVMVELGTMKATVLWSREY